MKLLSTAALILLLSNIARAQPSTYTVVDLHDFDLAWSRMDINDNGQIVGVGTSSATGGSPEIPGAPQPCPVWTISGGFHQGDTSPLVPANFGKDNISTISYGCALCAVATMLTSIPGLESMNPAKLNTTLVELPTPLQGYKYGDLINWSIVSPTIGCPVGLVDSYSITDTNTLNTYLQEHVCNGDRVILELYDNNGDKNDTHFVLVTNRSGTDWKLFDPGWKHAYEPEGPYTENDTLLTSLADHYSGFITYVSGASSQNSPIRHKFTIGGVRTYRIGYAGLPNYEPPPNLNGGVQSPVEVLVTDPAGHRIGHDSATGMDVFEIQDASYIRDYPVADDDEAGASFGDTNGIKTFCIPSPMGGSYQAQLTGTGFGNYTFYIGAYWSSNSFQTTEMITGTTDIGVVTTNEFFVESPPLITISSLAGNAFNLTFASQSNVAYSIQGSRVISGTNWTSLQTVLANSGSTTVSEPASTNILFYRVVAE